MDRAVMDQSAIERSYPILAPSQVEPRKARLVRLGARPCPHCEELKRALAQQNELIASQQAEAERQLSLLADRQRENDWLRAQFEKARLASISSDRTVIPEEPPAPLPVTIMNVVTATCRHFGMGYTDIISARRTMECVVPRQVAMYLARTLTTRSMSEIGRRLGGRDHTTILHAYCKIKALIEKGDPIANDIAAIRFMLEVAE